jgi:hypothetical protein
LGLTFGSGCRNVSLFTCHASNYFVVHKVPGTRARRFTLFHRAAKYHTVLKRVQDLSGHLPDHLRVVFTEVLKKLLSDLLYGFLVYRRQR